MLLLAAGLIAVVDESLSFDVQSLLIMPTVIFAGLTMMAIGTVFCAAIIALIGVPVAWAMGRRLDSQLGLAVAAGAALVAGGMLGSAFWSSPLFGDDGPILALMILGYALPAGLFYRRAVLSARSLSVFAEAAD
jgi:hypothetical protein